MKLRLKCITDRRYQFTKKNLIFQKNSFNTLYFYALLFPRVVYISHSTVYNFHLKPFEWNSTPGITYFSEDLHSC